MSTVEASSSATGSDTNTGSAKTSESSVVSVVKAATGTSAIDTSGTKTLNKKMSDRILDEVIDPAKGFDWSSPVR